MLLAMQAKVAETEVHNQILRQLVFKDMNSRDNQIHKAAQDTYTWTLEDGPVKRWDKRSHAWGIFLKWLRVGDNILHVSGNPGSGKSTLMKFLAQHDRTKEELMVWAGANTLVFCVFYFWNSGSEAQRTLSGLYRSLLFQSLSQCPDLIKEVFPLQFRKMSAVAGNKMLEEIQGFGEDQVKEAFDLLLDRACQSGYRLCFFIDGLDECEGNRLQHESFVLMLQTWTASHAIKLCVSSRPYSEFTEPLSIPQNRLVQLHEVNECDIRAYCLERFEKDMHARERGRLCQELAEIVVRQAQGVFLWVYLVIDILLIGLRQADPDSVLRAQLNELPRDLDQLYTKLREPIEADNIQRDRSNRILLLAAHNPSRYSLTHMAFSWLEEQGCDQGGLMNPDFPQPNGMNPYTEEEVSKRVKYVTKQINGLARGFLEVGRRNTFPNQGKVSSFFDSTVQFCHRTARDYLLHNKDRQCGLLDSFPNFEQSGVYTRVLLAETIHGYKSKMERFIDIFNRFTPSFCSEIDSDLVRKFELPVRDLVPPLSTFLPPDPLHASKVRDHGLAQVSFTEYAAFCGLSQYVLREVATDATKLDGITSHGDVVLAALANKKYDLVSQLLRSSTGKRLCTVWDEDGKVQSQAPACVLAVTEVLRQTIGIAPPFSNYTLYFPKDTFHEQELKLFKDILRFTVSMKISMRIRLRGVVGGYGEPPLDDPDGLRVQIDIGETLQLLENCTVSIAAQHYGWRCPAHHSNILRLMSTARLGQLVDKGKDATHVLKEWPDQPHPVFSQDDRRHQVFMEKVEWGFDNQNLVELKGWVRVY